MSGQRTQWNEATRVQMPALVHLTRIGFTYFGKITEDKAGTVYDPDTNILIEVFKSQFAKLNPERAGEAEAMLRIIRQELDNDDIGESFYKRLKAVSPVRLIDFEHPENNTFHCSAEFTCKRDEDEFRPDITLFVNGLPLVFIEVKKPNNIGGMVAEAERMNKLRFPNKKFRRFINITQLMIFSNNMEYDAMGGIVPIQGVFYCTGSKKGSPFNCFREENPLNLDVAPYNRDFPYKDIDPEVEKQILSDFNNQVIHTSPEYQTNLRTTTPTNRVLTSMCSPDRLLFLLKYGITYYHKTKELDDGTIEQIDQKHIMRYQQFFAAMIVRERISEGTTSGIIWHTQGSGKTALSFHLSYVLTDYFASINKVTKFYFIVDRLDLMKQSKEEFTARGLVVKTASSRAELMEQFRTNQSQEGTTGEPEITVVNIQRFEERQDKVVLPSYATNLQRVFIIDEAHRGYKPEGSFLANLFDADPNSIKIALTGTPLLKSERESWRVFGNYLHTYYYDKSVQDGYTLKIIREDIETSYKEKLEEIYHSLENLVQKKDVKKDDIIEHPNYVKELLRYIITDLKRFRIIRGDDTLGGMVICETSEQARRLFAYFDEIQNELNKDASSKSHFKVGLSTVNRISVEDFPNYTIPAVKREQQDRIAGILGAIDKKISTNNAINDNLAQQAQLLFDFMFQDISGSKHIGDFIVPQRGTALLSKDAIPGDIPVVAGGLVPSTYHNAANTVAPVITISSSGANAGFVNLWGVPVWSSDSSFIDFKMTPYVYFWHALLKRHQNNIYKIQTGSAQPHIYPSHIASLPVCDLDFGKVADYTERVTPLFTLISKNYKESNQLRALRDWLLPMLMNGQATISD